VTKFVRNFPEPARLNDRRGTACQVIHNLGAAGKSAALELVRIFKTGDNEDWNSASMALNAVGIDAEIAKQLVQLVESGVPDNAKPQIFWMLEKVTPPSARAVKILGEGLESNSVWVQQSAAQVIGRMKAVTPPIAAKLREIQGTTDDVPLFISVTSALWMVEKNKDLTFSVVTKRLESEIQNYQRPQWPGNGGQAIDNSDQAFISAANFLVLYRRQISWC
jgi:hypothetical protein